MTRRTRTKKRNQQPHRKQKKEEEPDGLAERAGAFAELPEVQLLLCVAILADVAGAAVTAARAPRRRASVFGPAAAAFPGFVNFLYAFELLALATAFKLRMLTHPGLLLDVGIVSVPPASFVSSARRWRYEGRTSRRCRRVWTPSTRLHRHRRERGSTGGTPESEKKREMTPSRRCCFPPRERERKKQKKKTTQALFAADPEGNTNTIRLLGFLRLWRLSRLHETLVAAERTRTEEKAQEARTERERALRAEVERARLEGVAAESANARQRLEKMARAFKDEIDTLNEALVIAARDIAEAADSEIESEAEREGGEVQGRAARAPKDEEGRAAAAEAKSFDALTSWTRRAPTRRRARKRNRLVVGSTARSASWLSRAYSRYKTEISAGRRTVCS